LDKPLKKLFYLTTINFITGFSFWELNLGLF
jgi:hypothetical protein